MKLKATAVALVLTVLPTFGMAECNWGHSTTSTTLSCPEGQVYDAASGTCVVQASS